MFLQLKLIMKWFYIVGAFGFKLFILNIFIYKIQKPIFNILCSIYEHFITNYNAFYLEAYMYTIWCFTFFLKLFYCKKLYTFLPICIGTIIFVKKISNSIHRFIFLI